jgi:hypothetical protein
MEKMMMETTMVARMMKTMMTRQSEKSLKVVSETVSEMICQISQINLGMTMMRRRRTTTSKMRRMMMTGIFKS